MEKYQDSCNKNEITSYVYSAFNLLRSTPILKTHTLSSVAFIVGNIPGTHFLGGGDRDAASSHSLGFSRRLEILFLSSRTWRNVNDLYTRVWRVHFSPCTSCNFAQASWSFLQNLMRILYKISSAMVTERISVVRWVDYILNIFLQTIAINNRSEWESNNFTWKRNSVQGQSVSNVSPSLFVF